MISMKTTDADTGVYENMRTVALTCYKDTGCLVQV